MTEAPSGVAVAVVTYNSAHLLAGLITSLPLGMGGTPWHLVVADNDSQDGTVDVLLDLAPDATVIRMGRNAGYAAGVNAAVNAAGPCRAMLVLNPDVRLTTGCAPALLDVLTEPGVGVAVPRLVDGHGSLIPSIRREPTLLRAAADALLGAERAGRLGTLGEVVTDVEEYTRHRAADWAEGSTQLISRECWERCGPWDESYFLYSEETDFHLRVRDAGLSTRYVPTALAVHLGGESTTSPQLWSMLVANRVKLFAARNGRWRTGAYWLTLLIRETSRAALGKPTSRMAVRTLLSPRALRSARGPAWPA